MERENYQTVKAKEKYSQWRKKRIQINDKGKWGVKKEETKKEE